MYFIFGILLIVCLIGISMELMSIVEEVFGQDVFIMIIGGVIFGNCDFGRVVMESEFIKSKVSDIIMVRVGCLMNFVNICEMF